MNTVTLRLNEFCKLYPDVPKATIQSIIAREDAPFAAYPEDGKQRTYGSGDVLAWCLFTQLRNMGIPAQFAAGCIRDNHIVDQIFKADDPADLFLIVDRQEKRKSDGTVRSISVASLQDFAGVTEILTRGAVSGGSESPSGETRLGLSGATIVPVLPCMERCEAALDAAGFVMDGPNLYEKD